MEDIIDALKRLAGNLKDTSSERELEFQIYSIVLPALEWDATNPKECKMDYSVSSDSRIDMAIFYQGRTIVFIEAKAPKHDFTQDDAEQFSRYAYNSGATIALLTNGYRWLIFYPLMPGVEPEDRLVAEGSVDKLGELSERLDQFLSKKNVVSGKAAQDAQQIIDKHLRRSRMERMRDEVIREFLNNPSDLVIKEIAEEIERRCGERP